VNGVTSSQSPATNPCFLTTSSKYLPSPTPRPVNPHQNTLVPRCGLGSSPRRSGYSPLPLLLPTSFRRPVPEWREEPLLSPSSRGRSESTDLLKVAGGLTLPKENTANPTTCFYPGLATRHNWPLRRDLRKVHRLCGYNFRVSPHQITPVILLFDPLIAHSNYMVTGFKNLVSYR
jgi:hypothetical protein